MQTPAYHIPHRPKSCTMSADDLTTNRSSATGLLTIPFELRIQIYKLAFPPAQIDIIFADTIAFDEDALKEYNDDRF